MYNTSDIAGIRDYMIRHHHTLAVAESVTSGHLQAALSLADGASGFFQGGITAYNLGQKARHLHVNPIHATSCNSVSEIIADEMALQTLRLFSSDWAIAITGYAAPLPEMGISDLFAFYSIAFRHHVVQRGKLEADDLGLLKVQLHYTREVMRDFNTYLSSVTELSKGNARV